MPTITIRGSHAQPASYRFDQDTITIGRSPENHLVLVSALMSRRHAEIRKDGRGWVVADLGSRNGILLNGKRITDTAPLRSGDEINLGGLFLTFEPSLADAKLYDGLTCDEAGAARAPTEKDYTIVGRSGPISAVLAEIERFAASTETVLITGENGTGKELVARMLHRRSPRAAKPFVAVSCPALAGSLLESELFGVERGVATGVDARPGQFEAAQGGTLFLDEVGDMDLAAQSRLLRVLQEKHVPRIGARSAIALDVRVIAATNQDLEAAIARNTFRRDLYHRLAVLPIVVPPLRERREDIHVLVDHFLRRPGGPAAGISREALDVLCAHDFPGNIRELEHVIVRARLLAKGPEILLSDLPMAMRPNDGPTIGIETPTLLSALSEAPSVTDDLYHRLTEGGEAFADVVRQPFLTRHLSREDVRTLIHRAYREAGGSYKGVARLFGVPDDEHKKFLDFLGRHGLGVGKK